MNVSIFSKMDYENKWQRRVRKNKPNSNPIKANFKILPQRNEKKKGLWEAAE